MRYLASERKRKIFGQHFLIDEKIIHRIVSQSLDLYKKTDADSLIEIGPGKGAITHPLLESFSEQREKITLVEKDRVFAENWKESNPEVSVIEADFLDLNEEDFLKSSKPFIVSNLPYSASSQIILKLISFPQRIAGMVFMVQKEVAERLKAKQGDSAIGRLTLIVQNEWEVQSLCVVPPRSFRPAPKVFSEVLIFSPRETPRIPLAVEQPQDWQKLTQIAFMHRRKTLKNNLQSHPIWKEALEKSGIDGKKRAEALSWGEWENLLHAKNSTSQV